MRLTISWVTTRSRICRFICSRTSGFVAQGESGAFIAEGNTVREDGCR